jgi:formylglycine-generating enzyme required for sulfatase activity
MRGLFMVAGLVFVGGLAVGYGAGSFLAQACSDDVPAGFVCIEAGTFMMGSPPDEQGRNQNELQHRVTLTHAFLLQATEVTQGEYAALMGSNPSHFLSCGASCPVERVTWYDAIAYANALSRAQGLPACYDASGGVIGGATVYDCVGYRLPTEAEWEYAARAGTNSATYQGELTGDSHNSMAPQRSLDAIAWWKGNSGERTHPVGTREPNAWGLHDMLGNVAEWSHDWYGGFSGPETDPTGQASGEIADYRRVLRGGAWSFWAENVRSPWRGMHAPTESDLGLPEKSGYGIGFRRMPGEVLKELTKVPSPIPPLRPIAMAKPEAEK